MTFPETSRLESTRREEELAAARWRSWQMAAVLLGLCVLGIVGLYWDTAESLVHVWANSVTYNHGFLVLPASVFFVWRRRASVLRLQVAPNVWGLVVLALLTFIWILGDIGNVDMICQFALVAILPTLVWTLLGTAAVVTLRFPLAFLFLAVPFGEELVPHLQDYTAAFAAKALAFTGVPVYREGRSITIPTGSWEVVESCSGIRYIIASVVFGCFYAELAYRTWGRRLTFIVLCAILPVIANGFRAYGIVLLAHVSNNRLATGVDHLIYGWIFFGMLLVVQGWIGQWWRENAMLNTGLGESPAMVFRNAGSLPTASIVGMAVGALLVSAVGPVWVRTSVDDTHQPVAVTMHHAATVSPPWNSVGGGHVDWKPMFRGVSAESRQSFSRDGQAVYLYIGYYARQVRASEVVNSSNVLIDPDRWRWVEEYSQRVTVDGQVVEARTLTVRSTTEKRLILHWYWLDGTFTANPYVAKAIQVKSRLLGEPGRAAVIALSAGYQKDPAEAIAAIESVLQHTSLRAALRSLATS